jgi:hypothetical protein
MVVGESVVASPSPAGVRKDELRSDEGRLVRDRRPRHDFRAALQVPATPGRGAGSEAEAATGAAMAGWFRAEVSPGPIARTSTAAPPRPVDRVLIGACGDSGEARIQIGTGALAGTEVRLHAAPGGSVVEAQLLTRVDGSRQTLSVVMDEIAVRLRSKGIALLVKRNEARRDRDDRDDRDDRGGRMEHQR